MAKESRESKLSAYLDGDDDDDDECQSRWYTVDKLIGFYGMFFN